MNKHVKEYLCNICLTLHDRQKKTLCISKGTQLITILLIYYTIWQTGHSQKSESASRTGIY